MKQLDENVEGLGESVYNPPGGTSMISRILLALSVLLVLSGCSTLPKPETVNSTLVIGKIVQTGSGFSVYNTLSVNGTNTAGIEITVVNVESQKSYELLSGGTGFFSSALLPPGKYRLQKLYLKVGRKGAWADLYMTLSGRFFSVTANSVNNLGVIRWNAVADEGHTYSLNRDYDEVTAMFERIDGEKLWSEVPMAEAAFSTR